MHFKANTFIYHLKSEKKCLLEKNHITEKGRNQRKGTSHASISQKLKDFKYFSSIKLVGI